MSFILAIDIVILHYGAEPAGGAGSVVAPTGVLVDGLSTGIAESVFDIPEPVIADAYSF
jgi:hypothetical protein